jgi:hypothetical protein
MARHVNLSGRPSRGGREGQCYDFNVFEDSRIRKGPQGRQVDGLKSKHPGSDPSRV